MKTKSIKALQLNKKSISNLVKIKGGRNALSTSGASADCNSIDKCTR